VFNEETREWAYPNGRCYLEPDETPVEGWELSPYRSGNGITLAEYVANGSDGLMGRESATFVYAKDITDAERTGRKGPRQVKVWQDVDE
jgi:hypothetical protein